MQTVRVQPLSSAPMQNGTLDRLAELAVGFGANVQPGQIVCVHSEIGREELSRAVAAHAYRAGTGMSR